ncbi:hypothetical protein HOC13_01040 [Candidatus Woesearchaeota archaeon]|jgi:hypothetical protein|nr:hypothetical protein [Candidatus Woesearchaeota archaeon]
MVDFILSKCKTKAAFSAKLNKNGKLDLGKLKEKFEVVMETSILLVLKIEGIEIVVHRHGELLFKNCEDVSLMEKIAEEIYSSGLR